MKHLIQDGPECLATSLCMILDKEVKEFYAFTNNDGMDKVFAFLPQMVGINMQECIDFAASLGHWLVPIHRYPTTTNGVEEHNTYGGMASYRFYNYLKIVRNY